MAYIQKNNPIPKTGCGRRRSEQMTSPFKKLSEACKNWAKKDMLFGLALMLVVRLLNDKKQVSVKLWRLR